MSAQRMPLASSRARREASEPLRLSLTYNDSFSRLASVSNPIWIPSTMMSIQAPVSRADAGALPSRSFCVLLLGFVLCLRPLRRVFTCPELLLVVLLAFVHDRWRASLMRGKVAGSDYTRPSLAPKKARRKTCTVVSISQEGKMALVRGGNDLAVDSPSTGPQGSCCWEPCRAIKTLEGQMDSAADSAGSGTTSNASDLTFLSTAAAPRGYEDDGQSDETEGATARMLPRRGGSLLISNSICMSRGVGEQVQNLVFSNASGDLQLRRDALFHVFRHWSDCSLHLSVLTGQLLVHRKSKTEPEIFPLVLFTGSSLHRRRPNAFKLVFYGHEALHFRTNEARDAELWVKALEYAKEFTWHLWT